MPEKKNRSNRPPAASTEGPPYGLAGMCWARHPTEGVHCTDPVSHQNPVHLHAYTRTYWR